MINQLNTYSKAIRLKMNLSKTQVMFNELVDAQDQIIEIEGMQLKVVESYTY